MTTAFIMAVSAFCLYQWWQNSEHLKLHDAITAWMREQEKINKEVWEFVKRQEAK